MIVNDETIVLVSVVIGAFKMLDDVEARLDAWEQRRSMLASSHVQQGGVGIDQCRACRRPLNDASPRRGSLGVCHQALRAPKTIEANIEAFRRGRAVVEG